MMIENVERNLKVRPHVIVASLVAIVVPMAAWQIPSAQSAGISKTEGAAAKVPEFAVAAIRPTGVKDGRWKLNYTLDGYSGMDVTVLALIQDAYGIYEGNRISGGPAWLGTAHYDVEAKVDDMDLAAFKKLDLDQRRLMLQTLLADRFKLKVHKEDKDFPIYALIVAKKGPRLRESKPGYVPPSTIKGFGGLVTRSRPGQFTVEWFTMAYFARDLSQWVDRKVVDKTGLTGHYDFNLDWTPDGGASPTASASSAEPNSSLDTSGPSIFTALQEQLGLKLKAEKGPVQILVIDHVEPPSAN
jgi:uncharacterized protein (TIGR03435 family)